jgi:deoxyribonuclease (pyrimidine dimer)
MLIGYARKYPALSEIPVEYCLGKGHIKFFKNKLKYLEKRHELLKKEMRRRGFNVRKKINLKGFPKEMTRDWKAEEKDVEIIKKRLKEKINLKPEYYRYCGENRQRKFFIELIDNC